jgi:uncharacterized protein YkwD
MSEIRDNLLRYHNQYRVANGRRALRMTSGLNSGGQTFAKQMGSRNNWVHTGTDCGRSDHKHVRDYNNRGFCWHATRYAPNAYGENLARGTLYPTSQHVFAAWKNSPTHNANILRRDWRTVGFGIYNWVALFGF